MEEPAFTSENDEIERQVLQTNVLKGEIACKVAKLQEELHFRSQLQHSLFQLSAKLKIVKSQQYQLLKENIDFGCQRTQLLKKEAQQTELVDHGKAMMLDFLKEITQRQKEIKMHRQRIKKDSEQLNQLSVKSTSKASLLMQGKSKLQTTQKQVQNSKELVISKQEMISQLKSTIKYYINQKQELGSQIHQKQVDIIAANGTNQQFIASIVSQENHLNRLVTHLSNAKKEENALVQQIEDQKIKSKLMKQKFTILQNRLSNAQQKSIQYQNCLSKKKENDIIKANQTKNIISNWLVNNRRWRIDLQYAKRYSNALSFQIY